jgi:hypothetical protein
MTIGIVDGNGGCFGIVAAGGSSFLASLAVIVVSARESVKDGQVLLKEQ